MPCSDGDIRLEPVSNFVTTLPRYNTLEEGRCRTDLCALIRCYWTLKLLLFYLFLYHYLFIVILWLISHSTITLWNGTTHRTRFGKSTENYSPSTVLPTYRALTPYEQWRPNGKPVTSLMCIVIPFDGKAVNPAYYHDQAWPWATTDQGSAASEYYSAVCSVPEEEWCLPTFIVVVTWFLDMGIDPFWLFVNRLSLPYLDLVVGWHGDDSYCWYGNSVVIVLKILFYCGIFSILTSFYILFSGAIPHSLMILFSGDC